MATLFNTKISATYPSLIKTIDNAALTATLKQLTDGTGGLSGLYANTAGDFKVTAILEWGSLKDTGTGVTITQFVTAANGIANFNNDTTVPTSAAVKTYVDAVVTASDLDFLGDSNVGTPAVDLDSQNFSVLGTTNEIVTSGANQTLTIGLPNSVTISGTYTGATFSGDLNGTINTATTATTQTAGDNSTKVATTAYVDSLDAASDLDFSGDSGTGDVTLNTQVLAITGTTNQIVTAAANQGLSLSLPATVHRDLQGNVTGNVDGDLTGNVTATSVLADGVSATTQASSDSSAKVATTAFVKGLNNASDLDFTTDSGSGAVVLNTETFSVLGTTNQINSAGSGQAVTLSLPATVHRNLLGNVTGDLTGNADTATKWETARDLSLTGQATGTISSVDGTLNVSGAVTLDNNSVTGKVLTGLPTPAASTVLPTDSILEGIGKIQSQINGLANGLQFQGSWNADTNSPNLISGGGEVDSGTTTSAATNKLIQTGQNFTSTVNVNDKVINQVDFQTAIVTNVDSDTTLSLDTDIMLSGEAYTIDTSPFITQGHYYVVNVGGATNLNGISEWSVGDWVIAGADNLWTKLDHTDVEGVGTPGNIAKWLSTGTIADSIIAESGAAITVTGTLATTSSLTSGSNFDVATDKFTANATTGNVAFSGDLAINTNKFTVNATSGDTLVAGNLSVTGTSSSFNTGNSGTFVTNDSSGYPRITTANSNAQLGLFRSGGSAGGMYIGANSGGLEIMTSAFATKFELDTSGNLTTQGTGTFAGNVSINSTSAPAKNLVVEGDTSAYATIRVLSNSTSHGAEIEFGDSTDANYGSILQFASSAGEGARMKFTAGGIETMNLRGGNVGVGTSLPNIYSQPDATNILSVQATGTNKGGVIDIAGNGTGYSGVSLGNESIRRGGIYSVNGSDLAFYTNPTNSGVNLAEIMRLDSSGNVRIGVTSTTSKLTVSGDIALHNSVASGAETNNILFKNSIYEIAQIKAIVGAGQLNRGELAFNVDNGGGMGTAMYINRLRYVGIGTDTPSALLEIQTAGTSGSEDFQIFSRGESPNYEVFKISRAAGSTELLANQNLTLSADYDANHTSVDSNIIFKTDNTEKMRLDSSGNVGIGTVSPNQEGFGAGNRILSVKAPTSGGVGSIELIGLGNAEGDEVGYVNFMSQAATASLASIVALRHTSDETGALTFRTSGSEIMRLTSGGNINIGSGSLGQTAYQLRVDSDFTDGFYMSAGTGSADHALYIENSPADKLLLTIRGDGFFNVGTALNSPYNVSVTGRDAYISSTGFLGYLSSTRKSKTNIKSIDNIDWLYNLNVVKFNYRKRNEELDYLEEAENEQKYGLIADEVEKVNKDFCWYSKDNNLDGIDYKMLIAPMIKAIQELKAEVDKLKQECKCK